MSKTSPRTAMVHVYVEKVDFGRSNTGCLPYDKMATVPRADAAAYVALRLAELLKDDGNVEVQISRIAELAPGMVVKKGAA